MGLRLTSPLLCSPPPLCSAQHLARLKRTAHELDARLREAEAREVEATEAAEEMREERQALEKRAAEVRRACAPAAARRGRLRSCAAQARVLTLLPPSLRGPLPPLRWSRARVQAEKNLVEEKALFAQVHAQMQAQVEQLVKAQRR